MRRGLGAGGGGRWPYGRCLGPLPEADAPREAQARDPCREQHAELAPHGCGVFLCSGGSGVQRGGGVRRGGGVQRGVAGRGGGVQQCNQQCGQALQQCNSEPLAARNLRSRCYRYAAML